MYRTYNNINVCVGNKNFETLIMYVSNPVQTFIVETHSKVKSCLACACCFTGRDHGFVPVTLQAGASLLVKKMNRDIYQVCKGGRLYTADFQNTDNYCKSKQMLISYNSFASFLMSFEINEFKLLLEKKYFSKK